MACAQPRGFLFTFVLDGLWGYRYYRPELFATTEPFPVLFFLLYAAIAVLFAQRQDRRLPRAFGVLLQLGGGLALLLAGGGLGGLPVLNGSFLSAVTVAAAGVFSAGYLQSRSKDLSRWEAGVPTP